MLHRKIGSHQWMQGLREDDGAEPDRAKSDWSEQDSILFESAAALSREPVIRWVKSLMFSGEDVWLLIDETQNIVDAELFTLLLKNTKGHSITTIGAGVPDYQSMSQKFKKRIDTDQLFLTSNQMLVDEGVVQFFESIATAINGAGDTPPN